LSIHCGIARTFGDYKISVHSGSDKLSVFPSIGRRTNGRFHLKTAGTSWLEAIRVVARTEPTLYRRVHEKALEYYPEALKSYHITPDLAAVPSIEDVTDDALPQLLDHAAWRQVLHVSYGGLLADNETGPALRRCLFEHEGEYFRGLEAHFERHFDALGLKRADLEEEER
ncbi:MAG: tagaturonate epimerase family protein, partial [Spirochaetota bacterium]